MHLLSRCSVICVHNCVHIYEWTAGMSRDQEYLVSIMQVPLLVPKGPCRVELYPIWDSSIFCKSFSTLEWRGAAIVPKEHAPPIEAHHCMATCCCSSLARPHAFRSGFCLAALEKIRNGKPGFEATVADSWDCSRIAKHPIYWYAFWLFTYT